MQLSSFWAHQNNLTVIELPPNKSQLRNLLGVLLCAEFVAVAFAHVFDLPDDVLTIRVDIMDGEVVDRPSREA